MHKYMSLVTRWLKERHEHKIMNVAIWHNVINQQPQPYGWSYKGLKGLALKNKTMGAMQTWTQCLQRVWANIHVYRLKVLYFLNVRIMDIGFWCNKKLNKINGLLKNYNMWWVTFCHKNSHSYTQVNIDTFLSLSSAIED